jgi:hypothetical protein
MVRYRLATITGVSGCNIIEFSILYRNIPLDFGFDHRRLRGWGPGFLITDVKGFVRGKKPCDYKEFGPEGLTKGIRVLCRVDDSIPAGYVSEVIPPRRRATHKKR